MKLGRMRCSNLFSYKVLEIDFLTLLHTLVVGGNGSGKTSIFDILCWIIFGQIPRKKYNKILRDIPTQQKHGWGEVDIHIGSDVYTIIRTAGKDDSLRLILNHNEDEKVLRSKTLVQAEIENIIGMNFKTFLNVAYFSQGDVGRSLSSTSTERIEIVSNILNFQEINDLIKEIDKDIGEVERKINDDMASIVTLESYINGVDGKELNKQKRTIEIEIKKKQIEKGELEEYLLKCEIKEDKLKRKDELINNFNISKSSSAKLISQNKKQIGYLSSKEYDFDSIDEKIKEYASDLESFSDVTGNFSTVNDECEKKIKTIATLKEKVKYKKTELIPSLESVIKTQGKECTVCTRVLDEAGVESIQNIIHSEKLEITEVAKRIVDHVGGLETLKVEKLRLSDEGDRLSDIKNEMDKLIDKRGQSKKDEKRIDELKGVNKQIRNDLQEKLDTISPEVDSLKKELAKYKNIDLEVWADKQAEVYDIAEFIHKSETDLVSVKHEIGSYSGSLKKINELKKEVRINSKDFDMKLYWKSALPKVKIKLISKVIPFMNHETNKYLNQILPGYQVTFIANPNKKQNKLDIVIEDIVNKRKRQIEGWSGGERDKMSLATYLALNKLASLRSGKEIDFVILDEKLMSIDANTRPNVFEMLKTEYVNRKIWMISHLRDVSCEFDQTISVKKIGGISEIEISNN